MKNRTRLIMVLMLLTLALLPLLVNAAETATTSTTETKSSVAEYDFRQIRWGMTKGEVMKSETMQPLFQSSRSVGYNTFLFDYNCLLVYLFQNKRLYSAVYYITTVHYTTQTYITDYRTLQELLSRKYGQPITDAEIWYEDSFKGGTPSSYGTALSEKQLEYYSVWEAPTTVINLSLAGNGSLTSIVGVDLVIGYYDKVFFPIPPRQSKDLLQDL